ncbi:CHASE2 domain-containing protein [Leptolyngbya sp. FACHB-261]|uniref:CHASE2 domain-containing protein n=1 Tax=Leptolyngbya sp. FACHB-261 TaxID=2692806 RepID=UPI0016876A40|nr:CHASE2 domain-containing protein [Leptolyngbya sp. FACHB-261]MBD2103050.1 CHASE2 domain-containing protein [Leptolyngbya sp. FACHB-261]
MDQLVVLSLGNGDLHRGFTTVTAQVWESGNPHPMKFTGSLPAAPELADLTKTWQLLYNALYQRLAWLVRAHTQEDSFEIQEAAVTQVSEVEFSDLCQRLADSLNAWLNSESFRNIDQQLRTQLEPSEEIRVIVETNDSQLRRIPWHLWNFFAHYRKAEVALSALEYQRPRQPIVQPLKPKVRILAILGNSKGIDLSKDRAFLEQLSAQAETQFLVEPQRRELSDALQQDWDILFFAGHSSTQLDCPNAPIDQLKGLLQLNQTEQLTLEQLKYGLQKAIDRGLKLAIFNSCDGLGLARELVAWHIPQVIVMREPVPDVVAHEFLQYFLTAFAGGQSLYSSVREARERLQGLEGDFPCATWLPVLCQNPAEAPVSWQSMCRQASVPADALPIPGSPIPFQLASSPLGTAPLASTPPASPPSARPPLAKRQRRLGMARLVFSASLLVTAGLLAVRALGLLQPLELQAFDQLMQLRPDEGLDPRVLVVRVTEADFQQLGEYPLSDHTLLRLLKRLEQGQPSLIGLDLYRDIPQGEGYLDLMRYLRQQERMVGICKVASNTDPGYRSPPGMPRSRLGFSDVLVDPDQVVRRHLLTLDPSPTSACTTRYALSAQLAFHYLEAKGISAQFRPDQSLQVGNVVFKRLQVPTGGYQKFDAQGYQVLLNYRVHDASAELVPRVTVQDVLQGRINPDAIKDRIVLIGVDVAGMDRHGTPLKADPEANREVAGVLVQAQMVSHILTAVLDGRPMLWVWPQWGEALWIWGWSMVGGVLIWRWRSLAYPGLAASLVVLGGLCFYLLKQGGWVPLVPPALALTLTSGSIVVYRLHQHKS